MIKSTKFRLFSFAAASLSVAFEMSQASQVNDGFTARLRQLPSCSVTANDVDFGNVTAVTNGTTVNSTIVARCTQGTPVVITFNPNGNTRNQTTGSMTATLVGNTDTIPYRLNIVGGCCPIGLGLNAPITRTLRGRITANRNVTPDTYTAQRTVYLFF